MIAEKSIYEQEVEELRQKCESGCEEVEELRQRLEEVIHARDMLEEEVQVLSRERQSAQQEVSGCNGLLSTYTKSVFTIICPDCAHYSLASQEWSLMYENSDF